MNFLSYFSGYFTSKRITIFNVIVSDAFPNTTEITIIVIDNKLINFSLLTELKETQIYSEYDLVGNVYSRLSLVRTQGDLIRNSY